MELASLVNVKKTYTVGSTEVGLWDANLSVVGGDFLAIVGPSGSGKSTLLNLLGLLDTPASGELRILDTDSRVMSARDRADMRARHLSFVFQSFHLSPKRTVLDNVTDGLLFSTPRRGRRGPAMEALELVGLAGRAGQQVDTLSGGERQRVAVARAIAKEPDLLLADEPTGNLDSQNSRIIFDLLAGIAAQGSAVVLVTHDRELAARCGRTVEVSDGRTATPVGA
ncbi:UNVERIFIED_ORG: ABC transporter ATP-binding protein [Bacillus sp. AZ43]